VKAVPPSYWGVDDPLVHPKLTVNKPFAKELSVGDKIAVWHWIYQHGKVALSRPVKGCTVIILDDLYQSGASLWSFAKYLKDQAAAAVVGLVCVKSLRDTDNQWRSASL
jgi:hypothetical protein